MFCNVVGQGAIVQCSTYEDLYTLTTGSREGGQGRWPPRHPHLHTFNVSGPCEAADFEKYYAVVRRLQLAVATNLLE